MGRKVYDFEINGYRMSILTAGTTSRALRKTVYKYLKRNYNYELKANSEIILHVKFLGTHTI
jgi:hypothetical protein